MMQRRNDWLMGFLKADRWGSIGEGVAKHWG